MDKKHEDDLEEQTLEEVVANTKEESEELVHLQKKVTDYEEKYKRAIADYQNLQRRTQEQKSEWIKSANKDLLLKLLPVLDTLMLAEKHIKDKGIAISIDQFVKVLQQEGLERIKTTGEKFDPHTMEAIATTEGENGKVLEEIRAGFRLYDTVIRSAQVIVGQKSE